MKEGMFYLSISLRTLPDDRPNLTMDAGLGARGDIPLVHSDAAKSGSTQIKQAVKRLEWRSEEDKCLQHKSGRLEAQRNSPRSIFMASKACIHYSAILLTLPYYSYYAIIKHHYLIKKHQWHRSVVSKDFVLKLFTQ